MDTIFISYRRDESAGHAGRIYDRLREKFGRDRVFMDVSAIEPGVDFVEAIDRAVGSCTVLLVVIGRRWLECIDATGRRRLDDPKDFVRLEVSTALRRNIRVVPVLVQDAAMSREETLPDELKLLARRNAIEINDTHWDSDLAQLVETLERVLTGPAGPAKKEIAAEQTAWAVQKKRLPLLIGSITAIVLALAGLLTGIDSLRDSVVRLFEGSPPVTTTTGTTALPGGQGPVEPAAVTVPRVIGMEEREAVETIRIRGLQPQIEQRISSDARSGTVFKQEPAADSALPAGGRVIVHVARAPVPQPPQPPEDLQPRPSTPSLVVVPNLAGKTLNKAGAALANVGLNVGAVEKRETGAAEPGTIIGQKPDAGARLGRGKNVSLVVAVSPAERTMVTVPNVVKQPLALAMEMLDDAGLKGEVKTRRPTAETRPDTILDQRPEGGAQAKRGTVVDLLVAAAFQGGPIQVRCGEIPSSIAAGGQAEIRILAYTEQKSPINGATVRIESGGGWFANSGTTTEVGRTDARGSFVTRWKSPKPAAKAYQMSVTVTQKGYAEGRGECRVLIK